MLVTNVNEPPVITGDAAPTFNENSNINSLVAHYAANDPERDSFEWSVERTDGSAFTIDTSGNLRFTSQPDHETKDTYDITIATTADGDPAEKAELPFAVTVTDVDEPPEIYLDGTSHNYDENGPHPVDQYFDRDPEQATTTFTWTLSGTDGGDFTIDNSGQLQFASAPDYERPADSGGNNVYNAIVLATDDQTPAKTGRFDVTVTVKDLNEKPTITGDDTLSYPENTATTRVLDRYTATDPERSPVTWSVGGTDADAFRIDSSGNLYFDGEPDHESPTDSGGNNDYDLQVIATDDGNLGDGTPSQLPAESASFDVAVTVTPVDEPPVVTGTTTFSNWQENDDSTIHTYDADEPEGDTDITWTLGGSDRGDFTIANGQCCRFANTPNFERPADSGGNNVYNVHRARHRRCKLPPRLERFDVTVTVRDLNEEPTITGDDTLSYPENTATTRVLDRYTATDPERSPLTWSVGGTDADAFRIDSSGNLYFDGTPDHETPTDSGGNNDV